MLKILIIDDENPILKMLTSTFEAYEDMSCFTAESGEEGIALAKSINPDIVLCDIAMPEMDGFEVLDIFRKDKHLSDIPFIVFTGLDDNSVWRKAMNSGADDFLTKPIRGEELIAAIRNQIQKKDLLTEQQNVRFETLFQEVPIPIFELDLSRAKRYVFEQSKDHEVDIYHYLLVDRLTLETCVKLIRILAVNSAAFEFFELEHISDFKFTSKDSFTESTRKGFAYLFSSLCNGETGFQGEVPFHDLKGKERTVKLRWRVAKGYEKSWGRIFLSMTDLSENIEYEKNLLASERKYKSLMESSSGSIVLIDLASKRIVECNKAFCLLCGFELQDLLDTDVRNYFDKKTNFQLDEIFSKKNTKIKKNVVELAHSDGRSISILMDTDIIQDSSTSLLLLSLQDLSLFQIFRQNYRLNRKRMLKALELGHIGSWEWNVVTQKLTLSSELKALLELSRGFYANSPEFLLEKVHPDDYQTLKNIFEELRNGTPPVAQDIRLILPSGTTNYYFMETVVDIDHHGKVTRIFGILQNITERKISELRNITEKRLEKDRFLNLLEIYKSNEINGVHFSEPFQVFNTRSISLIKVLEEADLHANTSISICIEGEEATGKSILARSIHNASYIKEFPFITVNPIDFEQGFFESNLVDTVKKAGSATIYINRVDTLKINEQKSLLILLDGLPSKNFRLISSCQNDLRNLIVAEGFRKDLYYRLKGARLQVPPLRDRKEDLELLIYPLLQQFSVDANKYNFLPGVIEILKGYTFPGNINELKSILQFALNVCKNETISVDDLPPELTEQSFMQNIKNIPYGGEIIHLSEIEKLYIKEVLFKMKGNKTHTAKHLGIGLSTLHRKLKSYGITDF